MDYKHYRLSHTSELEPYKKEMGEKKFYDYAISIYKYFAKMERGKSFDITKKVAKKNTEKFIKIACLYVIDFPGDLQFNDSFTQIIKL